MATLRNKRKLAAVTRETQEENPRNGQSRNTSVPRINEEYITQVSEQIEGRVTKKLSQKFSWTESRVLGALSKLDEFLLNQQITTHSRTVPEHKRGKPGNEWGRLPEWSSSWSRHLPRPDYTKLRPKRLSWQLCCEILVVNPGSWVCKWLKLCITILRKFLQSIGY